LGENASLGFSIFPNSLGRDFPPNEMQKERLKILLPHPKGSVSQKRDSIV
jgi:hypothetical protein